MSRRDDELRHRHPVEAPRPAVDRRVVLLSGVAILLALAAAAVAQILTRLIGLITNLAFYGRFRADFASPADNHLGLAVIAVPVLGALVIGLLARYGSEAIRGHGIPEAMERVLFHESRVPARITVLKPLSAAIAIGTGGPFGAEGPIIATGGALGSLVGQVMTVTAGERKTLLAAGAAAGMAATFGSPVSAVLLAVELLLFEYRPRSVIPVSLAAATATAARIAVAGSAPAFTIPDLAQPSGEALAIYVVIGALLGLGSVLVTRAVYAVEDAFERLPIHWMWWPAIGGLAVGVCGYLSPHTLGVGYDNIDRVLSGDLAGRAALLFCAFKLASWCVALGSGTSGGTLAPLFTIGGGLGSALGGVAIALLPRAGVDIRVAALVGMAAMFAGASRALLASVVFAFETTRQPIGLLPLLGGCAASYLVSSLLMKTSIMTEKIVRRGARVPHEYLADFLGQVLVKEVASVDLDALSADDTIDAVRARLRARKGARHTGFPVLDPGGLLAGVVTRTDLFDPDVDVGAKVASLVRRAPVVIAPDASLREAADRMVTEGVGRLLVVSPAEPRRALGIVTRSDLLGVHVRRLAAEHRAEAHLTLPRLGRLRRRREEMAPSSRRAGGR